MVMSALPPKAEVCGANRHVCFGPIADILCFQALNNAIACQPIRFVAGVAEKLNKHLACVLS